MLDPVIVADELKVEYELFKSIMIQEKKKLEKEREKKRQRERVIGWSWNRNGKAVMR